MDESVRQEIALFRYGLIAPFNPIALSVVDMFPQRIKKGFPDINVLDKDVMRKIQCQETLYL